jgi:hypothetical protein
VDGAGIVDAPATPDTDAGAMDASATPFVLISPGEVMSVGLSN